MICETKWRQQAEDRILAVTEAAETNLTVRRFLIQAAECFRNGGSRDEEFGSKKVSTSRAGNKANLKPRTVQQITASSR